MTLFPAPRRAGLHTALGGAVGEAGCPGSLSSDPAHSVWTISVCGPSGFYRTGFEVRWVLEVLTFINNKIFQG